MGWAALEERQGAAEIEVAEARWISAIGGAARILDPAAAGTRWRAGREAWCVHRRTPVVLRLDEADVLTGAPVVDLLRPLQFGFTGREGTNFPVSVGLIGMCDCLTEAKGGVRVNPGSAFHIKAASAKLRPFRPDECVTDARWRGLVSTLDLPDARWPPSRSTRRRPDAPCRAEGESKAPSREFPSFAAKDSAPGQHCTSHAR